MCEYTDAHAGAFFVREMGEYRRVAGYGLPETGDTPTRFAPGDGLLGQAIKDRRTFLIRDVPDGYLTVGSALGKSKPRQLIVSPALVEGKPNAVLEFGYIHPIEEPTVELLDLVSDSIGIAVRSAMDREKLQNLLEETQRQGEELQTQSEELRVSNEELEEQSRALKESQSRLEQQQAELEQTNSQLEEQTQLLETQRDDLNRTKIELEDRRKILRGRADSNRTSWPTCLTSFALR